MDNHVYSLWELNNCVRCAIEGEVPFEYWVQGELYEGRAGYGGHFYGELVEKDERSSQIIARARINIWARNYNILSLRFQQETGQTLKAGMKLLLKVKVTFHEQYGYALNVLDIDSTYTMGDLARKRMEILRQLEADGIINDNKTLPFPLLPQHIAVISSPTAAGYGDFCNQLQNNEYGFHFDIRLYPAVMQGEQVEESIIRAILSTSQHTSPTTSPTTSPLPSNWRGDSQQNYQIPYNELGGESQHTSHTTSPTTSPLPSNWRGDSQPNYQIPYNELGGESQPNYQIPYNKLGGESPLQLEGRGEVVRVSDIIDLIVIIRGGGASADLSDFDSYPLASCIAQCPIPVIVGIGHERDETVLDHVAHTSVKTPTAAAAFIIDKMCDVAMHLDDLQQRITNTATQRLTREKQRLERYSMLIPLTFAGVRQREQHRQETLEQRIRNAWTSRLDREQHRQEMISQRLKGLDPTLLLKRGYSITTVNGRIVRSAEDVHQGDVITTKVEHGEITSQVL